MNDRHLTPEPKKTDSSSRSSTSGEDGFVSGGSLPEENLDRLNYQFSSLGLKEPQKNVYASYLDKPIEEFASTLLSSDRSSEDSLMATIPQFQNPRPFGTNSTNLAAPSLNSFQRLGNPYSSMSTSASSVSSNAPQLPGAWFYEIGPVDDTGSGAASTGVPGDCSPIADFGDERKHTIESVEVPSSEHVAEIVGRQGCKIKALRNKTGTYIRSPPRGEDPIFVITGRPEDVMEAKREIECAAEHFTQIRASRRHSQGGIPAPGHITRYVRVPLRVVGLVVGPKGATIKRIQQNHHVYIITPSREREPIFEVTGLPHNVEAARRDIEQHIFQRTGNLPITDPASIQSYEMTNFNGTRNNFDPMQTRQMSANSGYGEYRQENLYGPGMRGYKAYSASGSPPPAFYDQMNAFRPAVNNENVFNQGWQQNAYSSQGENGFFGDLTNPRTNSFGSTGTYLSGSLLGNLSSAISRDEGLGDSPTSTFTKMQNPYSLISSIWNDMDASGSHDKSSVESGLAPQLATA